jgi:hypothetical protein
VISDADVMLILVRQPQVFKTLKWFFKQQSGVLFFENGVIAVTFFVLLLFFAEKKVTKKSRPKSKTARFRVCTLIKLWCYCDEGLHIPDFYAKIFIKSDWLNDRG